MDIRPAAISQTAFPSLLLAVSNSILEVFLICSAGYILARHGILDKKTQKQINRVNVSLFTPALLFSKVAFFLTPEKLKELWVIPLWFIIVTTTSMVVGGILGSLFGLQRSQRSFVMAAAMFMNSNALPLALMQSLVFSVPDLMWGSDDNTDAMLGRALTYLAMYSTMGMVLRYSYGVQLLSRADTSNQEGTVDERAPLLSSHTSSATLAAYDGSNHKNPCTLPNVTPPSRNIAFYNSFPNSANDSRTTLGRYDTMDSDDVDAESILPIRSQSKQNHCFHHVWRRIARAGTVLNNFMTAPLWAALLSLLVACIAPLKYVLLNYMEPLNNSITTAGKCSVPLTLVVLGAYFHVPDESSTTFMQSIRDLFRHKKQPQEDLTTPGETNTVILALVSRMIITPILLIPGLAVATRYGWQAVLLDPVFVVVNVILVCSPPALTLAQITHAASGDAFERLISRTIFWSYCVLTPPLIILCVVVALLVAV